MSDWTQDHYVTRNSTTDDPSGYRVWLTCRCGWDSGTLVDGFLPTTHRAELEHYVSVAPLAEVRRQAAEAERDAALEAIERVRETLMLHNPNGRLVKEVLAALDGAPEPEWEYQNLKHVHGVDHRWVGDKPGEDTTHRRRKAGPWEPVGGETDGCAV